MRLSLSKLERFLANKDFITKSFFNYEGSCIFVEVININTTDTLFIYINSSYELDASKKQALFDLKYLDMTDENFESDIKEKYAKEPDDIDIEKNYEEINLTEGKRENMEEFLEDNYKSELTIREVGNDDIKKLRELSRQLKRLKFCVQSINYKLLVVYKNYMCVINRHNDIDLYQLKNYEGDDIRVLHVMIDLENLYESINTVSSDISTIRQGVYNIFSKNQKKQMVSFERLMTEGQSIFSFIETFTEKKNQYEEYLQKLYNMNNTVIQSEKQILEKIADIRESNESRGGIQGDIQNSHSIAKYEAELNNLKATKHKIVKNIFNIRNKLDDMILHTDKVFFDNLVMFDTIIKNINSLDAI